MSGFVFQPGVRFLDPEKVLFNAGLAPGQLVADLGAGSGFFAIAASKMAGQTGRVFVVDIMEQALNHVSSEARLKGLRNIQTIRGNLEEKNACKDIPEGGVDLVILANVLHQIKNKGQLFKEAYRLLKSGGKVLVIDWNQNPSPIGPSASERISEAEAVKLAQRSTFKQVSRIEADNYHYGFLFAK
ncbi:MAG: methyltransferase domain-containing protein [Candidatus Doudnabacteria bacterium]|nr:methyltransferase domain-containing protein [Candidatus Doudnabacteria bacterium]